MNGSGYYVASLDDSGKRVTSLGLFARGNGTWSINAEGISFLRTLTSTPITIPAEAIESVSLSENSWWGGKWLMGARVVKVRWRADDDRVVTSGFVFSGKADVNRSAAECISRTRRQGGGEASDDEIHGYEHR